MEQEHEGAPPISRHSEYGPQGEGTQGFFIIGDCGSGGGAKIKFY